MGWRSYRTRTEKNGRKESGWDFDSAGVRWLESFATCNELLSNISFDIVGATLKDVVQLRWLMVIIVHLQVSRTFWVYLLGLCMQPQLSKVPQTSLHGVRAFLSSSPCISKIQRNPINADPSHRCTNSSPFSTFGTSASRRFPPNDSLAWRR